MPSTNSPHKHASPPRMRSLSFGVPISTIQTYTYTFHIGVVRVDHTSEVHEWFDLIVLEELEIHERCWCVVLAIADVVEIPRSGENDVVALFCSIIDVWSP